MMVLLAPAQHILHSHRGAPSNRPCWPSPLPPLSPPNLAFHPSSKPLVRCLCADARAGGVRIGGYPKSAPTPGPLGWQRPGDWDFLWAPARLALKAVEHLKPGQLVSAVPGLMSITKKVGKGACGSRWQKGAGGRRVRAGKGDG
jgi:hypothetical protein